MANGWYVGSQHDYVALIEPTVRDCQISTAPGAFAAIGRRPWQSEEGVGWIGAPAMREDARMTFRSAENVLAMAKDDKQLARKLIETKKGDRTRKVTGAGVKKPVAAKKSGGGLAKFQVAAGRKVTPDMQWAAKLAVERMRTGVNVGPVKLNKSEPVKKDVKPFLVERRMRRLDAAAMARQLKEKKTKAEEEKELCMELFGEE